jgi:hypothetical protein
LNTWAKALQKPTNASNRASFEDFPLSLQQIDINGRVY